MLDAIVTVLDALNSLHNNASLAHPNDDMLDGPAAQLAINFPDARLGDS